MTILRRSLLEHLGKRSRRRRIYLALFILIGLVVLFSHAVSIEIISIEVQQLSFYQISYSRLIVHDIPSESNEKYFRKVKIAFNTV